MALPVIPLLLSAQVDHGHRWLSATNLTYGLVDLDGFSAGGYASCRWGNFMDSNSFGVVDLGFNGLTAPPFSNANTDLFITNAGLLQRVTYNGQPFPGNAVWNPPSGTLRGGIEFSATEYRLDLYRYLHFSTQLTDDPTTTAVPGSARKLVVMLHGWNPDSKSDPYDTPEFAALSSTLRSALANTDWRLVRYNWKADADTGVFNILDPGTNPTKAAEISQLHGQHLGELLVKGFSDLEKIQLIAHSAGAWAARSTARYILKNKPTCAVQIVLLDPFMPSVLSTDTVLGRAIMDVFDTIEGNQQLKLLENYFADEWFGAGTREQFAWDRLPDRNVQVDGRIGSSTYSSHAGPIQFYADTVRETLPGQLRASSLTPFETRPNNALRVGWTRSLFYNEPLIHQNPQNHTAGVGATVTLSSAGSSRNSGASDAVVTYQWRRNGANLPGASGATLRINSVQARDAGDYTVTVSNAWGTTTSSAATLVVSGAVPTIIAQPQNRTLNAGQSTTMSVTAGGSPVPTYQWSKSGAIVAGATTATLTLNNVQPRDAGNYTVFVSNSVGSIASTPATLTVSVPPTITTQPIGRTVAMGVGTILSVSATGTEPRSYQWRKDGAPIVGATGAAFTLNRVQPGDAGIYTVVVSNIAGNVTSTAAILTVNFSRLINVSILTTVTPSTPSFTIGTVIGGAGTSGTKPLLVRAAGPSLMQFGVTSALADPKLDVFSAQTVVAANDNWGGATVLTTAFAQVGAFTYMSGASTDAAVYSPAMPAGSYTVQIGGVGGATGTALAELYDATPATAFTTATPRLVNVSVLKQVNAGEILTAGFVIGGTASKQVLIRAVGPTLALAPFNVPGEMADPKLELFRGQTVVDWNDNWGGGSTLSTAFNNVGAFALGATSRDAALLVTLEPGSYTAQVSGVSGSAGFALVEVYEVP